MELTRNTFTTSGRTRRACLLATALPLSHSIHSKVTHPSGAPRPPKAFAYLPGSQVSRAGGSGALASVRRAHGPSTHLLGIQAMQHLAITAPGRAFKQRAPAHHQSWRGLARRASPRLAQPTLESVQRAPGLFHSRAVVAALRLLHRLLGRSLSTTQQPLPAHCIYVLSVHNRTHIIYI